MSTTSSHSGGLYSENNPRITTKITRVKQEYDRKVGMYEKEFDLNVSRLTTRERVLRDSMLAYTERMRSITNARKQQSDTSLSDDLPFLVRARHIPKLPSMPSLERRPASLDELIGKQNQKPKKYKSRSVSKISLPALPEKYTRAHHVKISFVSASDLYDIVDFSIRNKATKDEANRLRRGEEEDHSQSSAKLSKEAFVRKRKEKLERSNPEKNAVVKSPLTFYVNEPSDSVKEDNSENVKDEKSSMKSNNKEQSETDVNNNSKDQKDLMTEPDHLKLRPNRARRMKLHEPDLNIIPENDIITQKKAIIRPSAITSPPPKHSPRGVIPSESSLTAIPENDWNSENRMKKKGKLKKIDPYSSNSDSKNETVKEGPNLRTKMKAQKRFKRLIYLRDVPDKHYQRS